jgi:uncharacterized protein YndB with AHSA1/START domain
MVWVTEASAVTAATPEQVWAVWADVAGWSQWDHAVESAELDGPFEQGTRGVLKPTGGPKTRFTMTEATPNRSFTDRAGLPLGSLEFIHSLTPTVNGTIIVHRVCMRGPLTPVFRRLIGSNIERGLPSAVTALARLAEGALSA